MDSTIINRTPHPITIYRPGDPDSAKPILVLPKGNRGEVARVEDTMEGDGSINGIPIVRCRWGAIINLPEPEPGVYHVVSVIVAEAAVDSGRGAWDLLVPGAQRRHPETGQIVGCAGLYAADSASPILAGQRAFKVALAMHQRSDPEAQNMRPEPATLVEEAEIFLKRADDLRDLYRRQEREGGFAYRGDEPHGALRCALLGLCRQVVNEVLANELLEAEKAPTAAVALLIRRANQAWQNGKLPLGRSGSQFWSAK